MNVEKIIVVVRLKIYSVEYFVKVLKTEFYKIPILKDQVGKRLIQENKVKEGRAQVEYSEAKE